MRSFYQQSKPYTYWTNKGETSLNMLQKNGGALNP